MERKNVLSFHGPINLEMVSTLANYTKTIVLAEHSVKQKVFRVLIELVQNVSFYSADTVKVSEKDREAGKGWLVVDENETHYFVSTKNLIFNEHGAILEKNCNEINSLNLDELRDLKRKTRKKAAIQDIGAHIGLIHSSIISGNSLNIKLESESERFSYFTIEAKIDK